MTRFALIAVLLMTGCKIRNEQSCEIASNNCTDTDGGATCVINDDCVDPTRPICDAAGVCVECIDNGECSGTSPVCNAGSCERCVTDNQCPSEACLDDGACALPEDVIFASANGSDSGGCGLTSSDPCNLPRAISESTSTRNLIKLKAETFTSTGNEGFIIDGDAVGHPVTFLARGAKIIHPTSGFSFTIKDGANVTLVGGTVEMGSGGLSCATASTLKVIGATVQSTTGLGIDSDACTLEVSRSTIHANFGGGIKIDTGTFVIIGNFIHGNGTASSLAGGVFIVVGENAANRLEFNSLNTNFAMAGTGNGVNCAAGATFIARNNIIFNNSYANNMIEANGCRYAFNDIGPMPVALALDAGDNINTNPLFVNQTSGDLHLQSGTPLIDSADPVAVITGAAAIDLDDDQRTLPTEMGADAVP